MNALDINSSRGKRSLEHEHRAADIFWRNFPTREYVSTPKSEPAVIDAAIVHDGCIEAVVETKCRDSTLAHLAEVWNYEWLITYDKLIRASEIASALCVPLYGFLYLIRSDILLMKKLFCPERQWLVDLNVRTTETQATINGGVAVRQNAYIDMSDARHLSP